VSDIPKDDAAEGWRVEGKEYRYRFLTGTGKIVARDFK
jgi:hypothetical protein